VQDIIIASAEGNVVELVETQRESSANMAYPFPSMLWDSTRSGGCFFQ